MHSPQEPNHQGRRSLRLPYYDYRQEGAYFITVCTHGRQPLFGSVQGDKMYLNEAGRTAANCWTAIPNHYPNAQIDAFIVMPNHIHGIILITNDHHPVGANNHSPLRHNETPSPLRHNETPIHNDTSRFRSPSRTVGAIVRGFKIGVTKWFRANTDVHTVWQRNYYENVIRNETALHEIRQYIINNPAKWNEDPENPATLCYNPDHATVTGK